jgi:regulator of sigma E protease
MNPHEEYDEKDPSVYPNRPTILRIATIFAGPFTNVIFASVLVFIIAIGAGWTHATGRVVVAQVVEGAPAAAVLKRGDVITAVGGSAVAVPEVRERVEASGGKPIQITFLRDGKEQTVAVTPRLDDGKWRIGLGPAEERVHRDVGVGEALVVAVKYPYETSAIILGGLWDVVTRKQKAEVTGPIGITKVIRDQINEGWVAALSLLAMLNVYLGLFNLLPLPALDGGRLAFLGYELATRRRPNPKVETAVHMAGMLVLLAVLFVVSYKEIGQIFFKSSS